MGQRSQVYADLPADLARADELLTRYGQWAHGGRSSAGRCGSAEGHYTPERGDTEDRRTPKQVGMHVDDAVRCQRALASIPDRERVVLSVIYVPRRLPVAAQLRLLRLTPTLCQHRHLAGVRMWWDRYRILEAHGA